MDMLPVVVKRRKRFWAKSVADIQQLGRSASQLARTSASKMSRAAVANRLVKFAKLAEIENACKMVRKFPLLKMQPQTALEHIRRLGFSQHREVSRHFSQVARIAEGRRAARRLGRVGDAVSNRTCHAKFQGICGQIADGSAKIIHVDPPYVYRHTAHGNYPARNARSQVCDNQMSRAGIALVVDLLRDWQPKLAPGGVLLL